jgi:serine protease
MKIVRRSSMLLLGLLLLSGSFVVARADEPPARPSAPKILMPPSVLPADQAGRTVPGAAGGHLSELPVQAYANDLTNPERPNESFPPMGIHPASGPLKPRWVCPKDFYLNIVDVSLQDRMIVKFTEESEVRWRNNAPYSKNGVDISPILSFLARHPEIKMRRLAPTVSEEMLDFYEQNGERNTGQDLANMNNYYMLEISSNPDPMALIKEVIGMDVVETAYYMPKSEPACTDIAPTTPSFQANQTYLGPASQASPGVDAVFAGNFHPDGRGKPGAWTIDVEWDWTEDHEDWRSDFSVIAGGDQGQPADHGDACSSIIAACSNAYGVTGESYNVTEKGCSWPIQGSWEGGFSTASSYLFVGESYFIEIHAQGPTPIPDPGCVCNCGQYKYICVEYWQASFDAIQNSTANGRLVYEAAGNGSMNLDNVVYGGVFNRNNRDSGAILVGAGVPGTVAGECWTNYGSRLDCSGWGDGVYASGYGDAFNPTGNRNQMYTGSFNGTSSSTPIVTGAGNDLQGISQGKYGITLPPAYLRSYLSVTGTPWTGSKDIGNRPNLASAIQWIEPDMTWTGRTGWYSALVPRNVTGGTGSSAPLTALDGNANDTYYNVSGINIGYSTAPDSDSGNGVYTRIYVDGDWLWWASFNPVHFNQNIWYNDLGPMTIRGGRHMAEWYIDPLNAFPEWDENNNWVYQQNVWSPLQLSGFHDYVVRSAPPLKSWGSPTYYNGDGLRGSPASGSYWMGCAVLPQSGNDVDVYSYADSYTSSSGFDAVQYSSAAGAGVPDLVLVNGNVVSPMNRLFQAIRYSDASTSDYSVELDASSSSSWYPPYTNSSFLGSNEIMDMYEIYMSAGTNYYIGVTNVTGGMDVRLSIYGQGASYYSIYGYAWSASGGGPNANEYVYVNPSQSGWYCAVVMKNSSASYGVTGNYTFDFQSPGAVNLVPGTGRSGWDAAVVARNTSDANVSSATFPAAITGNATNYLSGTWYNAGTAPTSATFLNRVLLDNAAVVDMANAATMNPFVYSQTLNYNMGNIRGGRHTLTFTVDNSGIVPESNESDNSTSSQYVWSPLSLTRDVALNRASPPVWGSGTYPNGDGFQFPGVTSYVTGAALLPSVTSADFDLYLYSDYSGTYSGYSSNVIASAYGAGVPDYVLVPWRTSGSQAYWYPAVINFNNATNNVAVEYENSTGRIFSNYPWQLSDPDTIPAGGIWNVYEAYMNAGTQYSFTCHMLSGSSDIEMRLHRDSTAYQYRGTFVAFANAAGPGLDETLTYTPTVTDWYALVIDKVTSNDLSQTAIYNLTGSVPSTSHAPLPVTTLVIQPWTSPNSVKLAWNHVTQDSSGSSLVGRRYVIYRNASVGIVPVPADSIGGTTDSTFIDLGASGGLNFYRVKVKSQ